MKKRLCNVFQTTNGTDFQSKVKIATFQLPYNFYEPLNFAFKVLQLRYDCAITQMRYFIQETLLT